MAFEELLDFGAPPSPLRWIFAVLAVEGSPVMIIWEAHEDALSADNKDSMLRETSSPPPTLVKNEVLIALQSLLQGLGKSLANIGLPEPTERQEEVNAERLRLRWSGDPSDLCTFKNGLTAEQVATMENPPPRGASLIRTTTISHFPTAAVDGGTKRDCPRATSPSAAGAYEPISKIMHREPASYLKLKHSGAFTSHCLPGLSKPVVDLSSFSCLRSWSAAYIGLLIPWCTYWQSLAVLSYVCIERESSGSSPTPSALPLFWRSSTSTSLPPPRPHYGALMTQTVTCGFWSPGLYGFSLSRAFGLCSSVAPARPFILSLVLSAVATFQNGSLCYCCLVPGIKGRCYARAAHIMWPDI
ncbi:hypothetical protein B0H13DRAFT_1864659 [Mycena leptocephala]|nr:hypothetical protein B0H13DRAFT_1864659 [Mycena leptocephala]